jgi:hypothetical protein
MRFATLTPALLAASTMLWASYASADPSSTPGMYAQRREMVVHEEPNIPLIASGIVTLILW